MVHPYSIKIAACKRHRMIISFLLSTAKKEANFISICQHLPSFRMQLNPFRGEKEVRKMKIKLDQVIEAIECVDDIFTSF